jgi:hypothetical protein
MVEYDLDWLKAKGFFKKIIPLELEGKKVLVDDQNLFGYVEVSDNEEIEKVKRELSLHKVTYVWFFFPNTGRLKVFRKIGEVKWFYYSAKMRSDYLKSRIDKLNTFSPASMNVLFDIQDIVDKFYWQLWEYRRLMAGSIKKLKEDKNKLLVVQHLIDRLIFFYFLSQLKLVRIKNKEIEWILDRKNTRKFFEWICETLDEEDVQDFLNKIFFDVLGRVTESGWSSLKFEMKGEKFFVVTPSLNGGLFIEREIEGVSERKVEIKGARRLILDILNKYNWIIGEESPEEEDVIGDLTPEIIGHIYEKFIVSLERIGIGKISLSDIQTVKGELKAGRRKIGAYYTPEEITNYISTNTIYPYIENRLKEDFGNEYKKTWDKLFGKTEYEKLNDFDLKVAKYLYFEVLRELKICDNACGSGSFLIAAGEVLLRLHDRVLKILEDHLGKDEEVKRVLNEIQRASTRHYYIVRYLITNNLYGVDIMEGAIEIAKLRFWLWLISQVTKEKGNIKIEPLPNLDFNIMTGNSLIGFIEPEEIEIGGGTFLELVKARGQLKLAEKNSKQLAFVKGEPVTKIMKEIGLLKKRFKLEFDLEKRNELKKEIETRGRPLIEKLNKRLLEKLWNSGISITEQKFLELQPFHLGFEFYEVFDLEKPKEERGFDIIIGNPPYGNIFEGKEFDVVQLMFPFSSPSKDSSAVFIERSSESLNRRGRFGMIVPLNIARIERFYDIRKFLIEKVSTYMILDTGNPFAGQVELEMIVIFYDFEERNKLVVKSLKPVPVNPVGIPFSLIRDYEYRFILYWDELYEAIIEDSILGWLEVSQGVPRRADYKPDGKYLCLSAISLDRYTIKSKEIQWERRVTEKFVRENNLSNQLDEALITPFSLGKTGKVTDLAFECIIKPQNYLPDGTTIFIKLKDSNISKKYALVLLNSSLINYITCRYILSYGVRIFRNYLFHMLPLRLPHSQLPFEILADYMLFLNAKDEIRDKEKELIQFIDKQIINSLVYELYLRKKFEQEGLKTNLLRLIEPYLHGISILKSDEQKLKSIKEVIKNIKSDKSIIAQIEKIKSHSWVKVIEGTSAGK